jgi:hypothetical protein
VCGRAAPNWGDERKRGTQSVVEDDDEDDDDDEYEDDDAPEDPIAPSTRVEIGGGEWKARQLCSDGSCVGVIGEDGKCKVCGKRAGVTTVAEDDDEDDDEADDDEAGDDAADADDDEDASKRAEASDDDGDDDDGDDEDGEDYEDDEDGDDEDGDNADDDAEDDELAAAADQLAGVASSHEVASAKQLAAAAPSPGKSKTEPSPKSKTAPSPGKPSKNKASALDDDNRQLCPDGGCIGVIGSNGKCKVCGKEAAA